MRPWETFSAREADDYDYDGRADALKPDWDLLDRHHWRRDFEKAHGAANSVTENSTSMPNWHLPRSARIPIPWLRKEAGSDLAPRVDPSDGVPSPRQNYRAPASSYNSDPTSVGIPANPQYYNPYPEDPPVQLLEQKRQPFFMERFNIKPSYPPPPPSRLEQLFQDYIVPFLRNTYPAPKAPVIPKHLNSGRRADIGSDTIGQRIYG